MWHIRSLCTSIICLVCLSQTTSAQPDYLRAILDDIALKQDAELLNVFLRVQERTQAEIYSHNDLVHIANALIQRATGDPDLLPDIITVLGQIGVPASVPFVMDNARSSDATVRLHACQALGWVGDPAALPLLDSLATAMRSAPHDTAMSQMVDYARKAIRVKRVLNGDSPATRFEAIRITLLQEDNWLVRSDILRYAAVWPDANIWPVLFDAYARYKQPPVFLQRLSSIMAERYTADPTGFMDVLQTRDRDGRAFGLAAIQDVAAPLDMGALSDLAEADSDLEVRERALKALGGLLSR